MHCASMETFTLVPGLRCWPGFFACTQTSTVVLFGSSVGLTIVTVPATGFCSPGAVIVALSPTFSNAASGCGMLGRAMTCGMLMTVSNGTLAEAIAPG